MDPFCYSLEAGQYNNNWRFERQKVFDRTQEAVLLGTLPSVRRDDDYWVVPHIFCRWALDAGLLTHELAGSLRDLALALSGGISDQAMASFFQL